MDIDEMLKTYTPRQIVENLEQEEDEKIKGLLVKNAKKYLSLIVITGVSEAAVDIAAYELGYADALPTVYSIPIKVGASLLLLKQCIQLHKDGRNILNETEVKRDEINHYAYGGKK